MQESLKNMSPRYMSAYLVEKCFTVERGWDTGNTVVWAFKGQLLKERNSQKVHIWLFWQEPVSIWMLYEQGGLLL